MNDNLYFADYGRRRIEETDREYIALKPADKKPLFFFGKYPATELNGIKRYRQYRKTDVAKPNGLKFAAFYFYYNMFKIFNLDGKLLKTIHIRDPFISKKLRNKEKIHYRTVECATNKYIYTIGFYENKKKEDKHLVSNNTSLEIWNWSGQPVYRAKFNAHIDGFTVSEKYNMLYGISADSNNAIYEYKLPESLRSE